MHKYNLNLVKNPYYNSIHSFLRGSNEFKGIWLKGNVTKGMLLKINKSFRNSRRDTYQCFPLSFEVHLSLLDFL